MNYYNACSILEIENNEVTIENLKKQYRRKALQYHPDKNKSENASAMFINITNAYEYLLKYIDSDIDIDEENINNGYVNTLFTFLQNI